MLSTFLLSNRLNLLLYNKEDMFLDRVIATANDRGDFGDVLVR